MQGSAWGRVIDDEGWGFDVSNVSRFNLGTVGVKSEYGYEYFRDDVETSNRFQPVAQGGVNPSGISSIGGAFSETTFSQGIFDFIAGLRYDTFTLNGMALRSSLFPRLPVPGPIRWIGTRGGSVRRSRSPLSPSRGFSPT